MFGWDMLVPYLHFLGQNPRYLGNDENILDFQRLEVAYNVAAWQNQLTRPAPKPLQHEHKIARSDSVLIKNHTTATWDPKYLDNFWVTDICSNAVHAKDAKRKPQHTWLM